MDQIKHFLARLVTAASRAQFYTSVFGPYADRAFLDNVKLSISFRVKPDQWDDLVKNQPELMKDVKHTLVLKEDLLSITITKQEFPRG